MTKTEIILTAVIWVLYGLLAVRQTFDSFDTSEADDVVPAIFIVIFSPLVLLYRAIYGIFRKHNFD